MTLDLPGLDDEGLRRLFDERGQSVEEYFHPLIDPAVDVEEAARRARIIAIATMDQGCCGPENPAVIRALLAALQHPDCRARSTILRVLANHLFDNAEQSDDEGPSDELYEGVDERTERWAAFRAGGRFDFLHEIHLALAEGVPVYVAMLEHDDSGVREAAAFALAPRYPGHDVRAELAARFDAETDPHALAAAILSYSLQEKYAEGDVAAVERFVRDARLVVRVAAAIALANHGGNDEAVLGVLEEGSRAAELTFEKRGPGVSLGHNNLRLGATRALARSSRRFDALGDDTIVSRDHFLDVTVARVVGEELLWSIVIPKPLSSAEGETREVLEALARHPGAFSRPVGERLGGPLELSRELGLRPPSRLVGALAERAVAALVGSEDLGNAATELAEGVRDRDLIDLVEDLLGHAFRAERMAFEWPDERPRDVVERLHAEGNRRDARTLLLGFRMLEQGEVALSALHRRASEATGDRLGIFRPSAVFVLRLVSLGARVPEQCARVLKHVAHIPELVPHVRDYLSTLPVSERFGPLTGWEDAATCFYADLLDAEGVVKLAKHYNWWIDEVHVVPFLETLRGEDPELHAKVLDALVERQGGSYAKAPGSVSRVLARADGTRVEVWGPPSPEPVNRMTARWP